VRPWPFSSVSQRRRETEAAIVEGYRRLPDAPTDAWLETATTAMVSAEPW